MQWCIGGRNILNPGHGIGAAQPNLWVSPLTICVGQSPTSSSTKSHSLLELHFYLLPKSIPSHPKGCDKTLLKPPYNKTITPPHHPSEQGLLWLAMQEQLRKSPPRVETTGWGWDLFFNSLLEGNSDVQQFLIRPHANLDAYVNARKKWHSQNIASVGCNEAKDQLLEIEQHAFVLDHAEAA